MLPVLLLADHLPQSRVLFHGSRCFKIQDVLCHGYAVQSRIVPCKRDAALRSTLSSSSKTLTKCSGKKRYTEVNVSVRSLAHRSSNRLFSVADSYPSFNENSRQPGGNVVRGMRNYCGSRRASFQSGGSSFKESDTTDEAEIVKRNEVKGSNSADVLTKKVSAVQRGQEKNKLTSVSPSVRQFFRHFTNGIKRLFTDVRLALQINRKLKDYDYDQSKLSREELFHLKQTKKDVIKTAPVTVFFMLPFIGYLAPLLAYFYPKRLLSRQFWGPDQTQQFLLEDHAKRSLFYLSLVREVGWACKESKDKELLEVVMKAIDGFHIENEWLLTRIESFEADEAISLHNMPRYHLTKLCKTWMIPARWYMPRKLLTERLTWRVTSILSDDEAIRRDGLTSMDDEDIKEACHHRGLEESLYSDESLRDWLKEWIMLTSHAEPVMACEARYPDKVVLLLTSLKLRHPTYLYRHFCSAKHISFIAHSAVFKSLNYRTDEMSPEDQKPHPIPAQLKS